MVDIQGVEDAMVSELKLPRQEARVYLLLLASGKMPKAQIAEGLALDLQIVDKALSALIEKGACIGLGSEYEALNPRFALTNIYRMLCHVSDVQPKRNIVIDQLATLLEKPYEDARAKTK